MTSFGDFGRRSSVRRIVAGLLCLALVACTAPAQPPSAPAPTVPPTMDRKPTAQQTATATPGDVVTPDKSVAGFRSDFEGCWGLESDEVSFEVRLEQEGLDVKGTFLLVKMCVVADELTACRIREGGLQGSVASKQTADVRLLIPEYDDEGTFRLKLTADGAKLAWEEIDYPLLGLADGSSHYLPPAFVMSPCGG